MEHYIESPEPPDGNLIIVYLLIFACLVVGFALGFGAAVLWWVP